MTQLMRHRQRSQGPNGVHEQRVRPVEGMDESSAIRNLRPARRLDGTGHFQRHFVEIVLTLLERNLPLTHEPPKVPVSGNIVKAMIMHANVRNVRGHVANRLFPADLQESSVACCVKLQQRRPVLKSLRPFGPAA